MVSNESSLQGVPESLQSISDVPYGTRVKLQKIHPETGEDIEQSVLLEGELCEHPSKKTPHAICVGRSVRIDIGSAYVPEHTSHVEKIERAKDGSYRIFTKSSVYRLIILSQAPQKDEAIATDIIKQPVRRTIRNLFGFLK